MKKSRIILIVVLVILTIAGVYAYKEYTRKPATAADLPADFKLEATVLGTEFEEDETSSFNKYKDKVIEVSGTISAITPNGAVFDIALETNDPMVAVNVNLLPEMNDKARLLKEGDPVVLKGICTGKNMDIELNKGAIKE